MIGSSSAAFFEQDHAAFDHDIARSASSAADLIVDPTDKRSDRRNSDRWTSYAGSDSTAAEWVVQRSRAFETLKIQTLLSEPQLHARGLRLFPHDASMWLVDFDADLLEGEKPCAKWEESLSERIAELRGIADDEAMPFSEESAREADAFARELNATRRPGAFLLANGNVRLLWDNGQEQIGLQFMGDGTVQYVMFARRGLRTATAMGGDEIGAVSRHITAIGLRHLLQS